MDDAVTEATENLQPSEQVEETPVQAQEKMISASRVEELVKKAKLKGRDAMQEQLEQVKRENEELRSQAGTMGGMPAPTPAFDADEIRQKIKEDLMSEFESQREQQVQTQLEKEAKEFAATYNGKMESGKENFDDFEEIMADFNPQEFVPVVVLANQVDNTAAVMYELQKNPSKLATLSILSKESPRQAQSMINKLSASIKANEQAQAQEKPVNAPLSRMQSSTTGQDSGMLGIRDFKRMFKG